jgi:hypothetical protein
MNTNLPALVQPVDYSTDKLVELSSADRVIEFYEEASQDYVHWSRGFNMHLGFYRRGLNPFNRETMLEQLNLEVAGRLQLSSRDLSVYRSGLRNGGDSQKRCRGIIQTWSSGV